MHKLCPTSFHSVQTMCNNFSQCTNYVQRDFKVCKVCAKSFTVCKIWWPLSDVPLSDVPLSDVQDVLSDVQLSDVQLSDVQLSDVPLSDVPLSDVPLSDVPLSDVPLSDVQLSDVQLSDVPLSDVPLSDVPLSDVPLSDVPLSDVPLSDVPLSDVPLADCHWLVMFVEIILLNSDHLLVAQHNKKNCFFHDSTDSTKHISIPDQKIGKFQYITVLL